MSYFDDASLVMIPSGYKTSKVYSVKPTDGSGDLDFTRTGDTATRVNSAGLIERVRTNLILQSNTFSNAAWTKANLGIGSVAVLTPNYTTDPFGGNNAWRFECNLNGGTTPTDRSWMFQSISAVANSSVSIYIKLNVAGSKTIILSNAGGDVVTLTSTNWVRISTFVAGSAGEFRIGLIGGFSSDTLDCSIAFAQVETGDIATDYIPTTTAAVSVGPVANVPRLDYLGSTCPRLLLEPQRTNLTQYSEQLNNAYWNKSGGTITANSTASPDGYVNADLFTESATTADHAFFDVVSYFVAGTTYTASFFVKANGRTKIQLSSANSDTCPRGQFDLVALTATPVGASFNAKIESYGNGWYRCSVSRVAPNTGLDLPYYAMNTTFASNSYAGNGTSGMYFWGMQMEAGAYATSYIPTLAASATRGADACSKTGISSLIGQTEGTVFGEFTFTGNTPLMHMFVSTAGDYSNAVYVQTYSSTGISMQVWSGASNQVAIDSSGLTVGQNVKFAAAYKNNDFAFYVNGVQIGLDTSGTVPSGLSQIEVGNYAAAGSPFDFNSSMKQALLFKTRLTNAELAELTAL